jgi:uncharacterized protein YaaQ
VGVKLLVIIVQDADALKLQQALSARNQRATKLASTGGFLRQGNTTFLVGVEDRRVAEIKDVVRATCRERMQTVPTHLPVGNLPEPYLNQPIEVEVGGAIIFELAIDSFERV